MKKRIVLIIISAVVLLGALGVYLLYYNKTDAERFSSEYTKVNEDNLFIYKNPKEVIDILENGTGVVYLGFPECPWCQAYASYLNEVAKEVGVDKINYLNIKKIRENNTKEYKKIVSLLGDNLLFDEDGNHRIFVPDVTIVKDGVILGHNNETSVITDENLTPKEYWTNEKITSLKTELTTMMKKVAPSVCTTCE